MLCAMAHSTTRGRAALGASDGAGVLLGLLRDPPYQAISLQLYGSLAVTEQSSVLSICEQCPVTRGQPHGLWTVPELHPVCFSWRSDAGMPWAGGN